MTSKKCVAAVNVAIRKALIAKKDDDFLYYILEEVYTFKGKKKIRKKAYRNCIKNVKSGCTLCSDHLRQEKKGKLIRLDKLIKSKSKIRCINPPECADKINLPSAKQPIQVKVSSKSKEKMKKLLQKPRKTRNISTSSSDSSSDESESDSSSESESDSDNSSESESDSDNSSSSDEESKVTLKKRDSKVNLVIKAIGNDKKKVKPVAIKIKPKPSISKDKRISKKISSSPVVKETSLKELESDEDNSDEDNSDEDNSDEDNSDEDNSDEDNSDEDNSDEESDSSSSDSDGAETKSDIMNILGGTKNKNLSEEIDKKFNAPTPLLSECNKIFTSNKTKVVKRNQPLFYNDKTQIVMTVNGKNIPEAIGVLLKVEYRFAPIIFDGNYCAVVKSLAYNDYLVQRCVLTNFVYYPNDDNQWVYVGTYTEKTKRVEWKTLNF